MVLVVAAVSVWQGRDSPGCCGGFAPKITQPAPLVLMLRLGLVGGARENWVIRGVLESKRFLFVAGVLLRVPWQMSGGTTDEFSPFPRGQGGLAEHP